MANTITFTTVDGKHQLTTKREFLETCPNPEKHTWVELFKDYRINIHLHNEKGPAILRLKDGNETYFIEGQIIGPEEVANIKHDLNFKNKLADELSKD